ncbi:MAG: exonuclease domain-containing protein [Ignavibacteriaceae bacterium]
MNDDFLSLNIGQAEFSVIDVETTGLSPRTNNIIEIGIVKISNLKIVEKYHSLLNPGRKIPYYISNITGITNDEIFNAPFFEEIAGKISNLISTSIITGHNISFDRSFLRKEFISCDHTNINNLTLCTQKIASRLYPQLKKKSLNSVCRHLKLHNKNAHRALSDAEVTALAFLRMVEEIQEKFKIKTIGELLNFQCIPREKPLSSTINKKLADDIASLPDAPGTYYFLNSKNKIIYIGKAKSLKNRVRSYFSPGAPRKAKRIIQQAKRLKIEITNSELTALLNEAESIKVINPRHNTFLKKYGSKYFLRINSTSEFPSLEVCNYFDFDGNDYFGLFINKKQAVKVFEMINRTFLIRECEESEFVKGRSCFLAEIERCMAPCIIKDKDFYSEELNKVFEFLYGKNQFALNRLINKMKDYSSQQKYEKAAETKELIDMILAQTHKQSLLSEPVNSAKVIFEITEGITRDYVLMLSGKIFVKKGNLKEKDDFEESLDDYFANTINFESLPSDEDLEKMKITLNWLIKNRNKVRIFYLRNYSSKQDLYANISRNNFNQNIYSESSFNLKDFLS